MEEHKTEEKQSQVILIKHVVKTGAPQVAAEPEAKPEEKTPVEKRKVVIKKKKVVVVRQPNPAPQEKQEVPVAPAKPAPVASASAPVVTKPAPAAMPAPAKPVVRQPQQAPTPVVKTPVAQPTIINPLHTGPTIIRPTNLPPVPGQGQSIKDHNDWQNQNNGYNQQGSTVPSVGPRQVGIVGGRPAYRPGQNGSGYNRSFGAGRNQYGNNYGTYNRGQVRPGYGQRAGQTGDRQGYGNRAPYGQNANTRSGFGNRPGTGNRPSFGPRPGFGNRPGFGGRPGVGGRPMGGGQGAGRPQDAFGQRDIRNGKGTNRRKKGFEKRTEDEEIEFQLQRKKEQEAARLAAVPKKIDIMDSISVADLAKKMNLKANEIISKLFKMGMMVTINQQIDYDTASIIANEYGCEVHKVSLYDETIIENDDDNPEDMVPRAPIVTVMGHVDHGKTKLLDAIRSSDVAEGEYGGITQHIGAYKVNIPDKGDIVFIDTPGHAAFSMMRARGAQVTDIVVLVVAADDGVMPQTREAIDHAKAANVPIIVAINKCDLPDAKPERIMQQLSDIGLMPEEWGGQTLYCKISALKKLGIDDLLDTILLQAEMMELKANPNCRAEGRVLEARIEQGRGTVATVLIQKGTLHVGDYYCAGIYAGRARAIFDDKGQKIQEAGPSTPIEIIGLSSIPKAGDPFQVTEDEKQARMVSAKRQELERLGATENTNKVTLSNLSEKIKEGDIKTLNLVIKGDLQGSVEALQQSLEKLSTPEIRLAVIRAAAGAIIESDVTLASASNALIIGFNVRPTPRALALAAEEKVEIRKYNIIYDVVDDVKAAMEGMLSPVTKEIDLGTAEVRNIFRVPKVGVIAGCMVTSGKVTRDAMVRVIRDNIQINKENIKISSLKRFKDDAKEVAEGFECGIGLENFQDLQVGDVLEIVGTQEVARKLEDTMTPQAAEEAKQLEARQ